LPQARRNTNSSFACSTGWADSRQADIERAGGGHSDASSAESSSAAENLTPAAPGQEGVIARDTVNELLLNPFDELKKVRLVPKITDGVAAGIEVGTSRRTVSSLPWGFAPVTSFRE
jgi:hypothetical protein